MHRKIISFSNDISKKNRKNDFFINVILASEAQVTNFPAFEKSLKVLFPDVPIYFFSAPQGKKSKKIIKDKFLYSKPLNEQETKGMYKYQIAFAEGKKPGILNKKNNEVNLMLPQSLLKSSEYIAPTTEALESYNKDLNIKDISKTVIFGSYGNGGLEESTFQAEIMRELLKQDDTKVIVVPRNLNRAEDIELVQSIIKPSGKGIAFVDEDNQSVKGDNANLVWVNRFGVLKDLYHCAGFSFISGTYAKKPYIQNPLEPAIAGSILSVGFNPQEYTQSNSDLIRALNDSSGLLTFKYGDDAKTVAKKILKHMKKPEEIKQMSSSIKQHAESYIESNHKIMEGLRSFIFNDR